MNRKNFLKMGSLGLASINLPKFSSPVKKPIVVSTWDSGMPVNAEAWKILSNQGKSVDAVEAGAIYIENDINCCVGLGGYPDRDGIVTLDACIMDEKANCGAVAGLEQIKHPISVARKLMESTPHVILVGAGAQQFALENGFKLEKSDDRPTSFGRAEFDKNSSISGTLEMVASRLFPSRL
jgi:N4-(beta-N-acetylglucosaminyl)-L-asparaginase